jgi:hypothetical protein
MNAVLLTAIHGRHLVAAAMLRHAAACAAFLAPRHTLRIVAVLSEDDIEGMAPVLKAVGANWCIAANKPVSWKWQRGLDYARTFNPDAVCILGSDDFATPAYWSAALDAVQAGSEGVGPDSVWMLDSESGDLGRWQGPQKDADGMRYPCGAGRVFSRDLLDRLGWMLWPFRADIALDAGSWDVIRSRQGTLANLEVAMIPGAAIVDFKNGANLHSFNEIPFREFIERIPARARLDSWGLAGMLDLLHAERITA